MLTEFEQQHVCHAVLMERGYCITLSDVAPMSGLLSRGRRRSLRNSKTYTQQMTRGRVSFSCNVDERCDHADVCVSLEPLWTMNNNKTPVMYV